MANSRETDIRLLTCWKLTFVILRVDRLAVETLTVDIRTFHRLSSVGLSNVNLSNVSLTTVNQSAAGLPTVSLSVRQLSVNCWVVSWESVNWKSVNCHFVNCHSDIVILVTVKCESLKFILSTVGLVIVRLSILKDCQHWKNVNIEWLSNVRMLICRLSVC